MKSLRNEALRSQSNDYSGKKGAFASLGEGLESGKLTNNQAEVQSFQNELKISCHRSHALAVSSGTMALHLLIRALIYQRRDYCPRIFFCCYRVGSPMGGLQRGPL